MNYLNNLGEVAQYETTVAAPPTTTEAPTAQEFIYFTKLQTDLQALIVLHFISDSTTFCHALATCGTFHLLYLSPLLTNEGQELVGGTVTAQQVFNKHPGYRSPPWILHGPGGERLYAKSENIIGGPLTFMQLREGTLSLVEVKERERNPQARWRELKNQLLKSLQQQGKLDEHALDMIEWLNDQMMQVPSDSESMKAELGPYLRRCILDCSWSLEKIVRVEKNWVIRFEQFLYGTCIDLENNKDELTVNELAELFHIYYMRLGNVLRIWRNHYVQQALDSDELRLKQLVKLHQFDREESLSLALANKVIRDHLESGDLTVKHLVEVVTDCPFLFEVWAGLQREFVHHDFFNSFFISLLEKLDWVAITSLFRAIRNPHLQTYLNVDDVEQVQLCWQHIFDLVTQNEKWLRYVRIPSELMREGTAQCHAGLDQLICGNLLTKLSMSLTTEAVTEYMSGENDERTLTMSEWIDLIIEEDRETAPFHPLLLKSFPQLITMDINEHKGDLPDAPFCHVLDKCRITPFHYAKIALALCHPEAHTLSLEELKARLKGDPLSGYRIALFGLSGPPDDEYRDRVENEFARALSASRNQSLLIRYELTMEELLTKVRECHLVPH